MSLLILSVSVSLAVLPSSQNRDEKRSDSVRSCDLSVARQKVKKDGRRGRRTAATSYRSLQPARINITNRSRVAAGARYPSNASVLPVLVVYRRVTQ